MVIVSGHLVVAEHRREAFLSSCRPIVEQGRSAPGCLDFAISPDLLDPDRVNVLECWESQEAVDAFRGSGIPDDLGPLVESASVAEHDVTSTRSLT
ncbi:putative quinol monooxygenase [Nocardioides ferulae]|uniref:putative quinol monooxygenase n=1 Tax=Nocardioides ferulae TaxID=2340821 RepID=UPI000EB58B32|nr:antibiotic biosynthesis monooxygenase [Nocardioides ferulae]